MKYAKIPKFYIRLTQIRLEDVKAAKVSFMSNVLMKSMIKIRAESAYKVQNGKNNKWNVDFVNDHFICILGFQFDKIFTKITCFYLCIVVVLFYYNTNVEKISNLTPFFCYLT